jgi:iron complex outermembrane receptor protein
MSTSNSIRHAVRYALLTSAAAAAAGPAYGADQTIQEVVVTGSRIAQPNLETTSPVTQVTAEDIAVQGVTRVEDLINQLPQAFAAQNANVSNGATGTATVNLRGLGAPRTLVLIDGRRMPFGGISSASAAADLNQIPAAMVERVEVLTGGASAAYGSDAIGGVVNFIMKKDFEGVQFDAMYGLYQHQNDFAGPGATQLRDVISQRAALNPQFFALPDDNVTDGEAREFNVLMGVSTEDGRGNITAYAGVRDNKQVLQRDRDYSACSLDPNPTTSFECGGSATSFPGYFYSPQGIFTIDQTTGNTFRDFVDPDDLYNFGPTNHYQRPDTRYVLGAMGHYELHESADVYTQLMFSDYESVAQIAPGGNFFDTNVINCDNPFLSASQASDLGCGAETDPDATIPGNQAIIPLYIARRNVEGGGRQQRFENTSFRAVLGVRGQITENWDYDAFVQYSTVIADQSANNYFHKTRIARALDAVDQGAYDGDPTHVGTTVCRSVVDGTDPNCVPWNPFTIGGVTPESLAYVQVPGLQQGKIEQEVYSGTITGDLGAYGIKSPFASESIKVAFGVESRRDNLKNVTDDPTSQDLLSGAGGATIGISGATDVLDLFTELRVPLVQDVTFADQLGLELAYRYSDYDPLTTDTYKVGVDWAPVQDVRFRASYQRAIRAPNVVELFTAQGFNLFDLNGDPCGWNLNTPDPDNDDPTSTAPVDPALAQACIADGVPAGTVGRKVLDSPAGQYNFLQGGVPDLVPETSDTYTYGVVLQPSFLPKLAMSIDYFDIQIDDALTTRGADSTLQGCYVGNDPASCALTQRNEQGSLWRGDGHVIDLNTNIGGLNTKGWDFSVGYSGVELGSFGELSFNLVGTVLDELTYITGIPGVPATECAGKYSGALCGIPNPEWRHHFRVGWETPWNVDLALTWRYYDAVTNIVDDTRTNIDYELAEQSYFDLVANWAVTEKSSVILGINNVLDDNPPITSAVGTTGNGNTFPQTYDALGRWIFVRGSVAF